MAQKELSYKDKNFHIAYELINQNCKKTIVFLHGWGSNKEVMLSGFKNCLKDFRHIYIDMPGFGKSSNESILTTNDYAQIIKIFLNELSLNVDELTIVGHSFGGKVATLLNPKNLVLLSTAGIIEAKPFNVKFKIFLAKFLRTIGLSTLTKAFRSKDVNKMSENMYATFKNVVDEDFTKNFANFANNTLVFWGESDSATSLTSGEKIASLIKGSKFKSYGGNHYFFLENANDISERIENGIL